MKMGKKVTALMMAILLMAGCGSNPTPASSNGASADSSDQTVAIAIDADLNTMDYGLATDGNSFSMQSLVMSGLTELDAEGQPLPELAQSWDISDDGLIYTFHLADAKWSNGEPVTAADFVYGWQRLDNADTASEYAFILETMHVKNAAEVLQKEKDPSALGIQALDDKTLQVELTIPCDFLLPLMAFPPLFPLNQKFYEAQGDQFALTVDNMLYCGPYTMKEYTSGSQYVFEKNPNYFKADKEKDMAQTVIFKYLQDTQSAMLDYQSGNLDVVKLQGEQVDQYQDQPGFTNRLAGYLWYLTLNLHNPDLANLNLRKAMVMAVDRETICANVLKDGSIPAEGIVPRELSYGADGTDYRDKAGKLISYDQKQAQAYYDQAKEELGHDAELTLLYEDSEASKAAAEYIQSNLEALGMKVNLDAKPKKTRLKLMSNHEYEVCLTRWGPDYGDPETFLDLFITDGVMNYGYYSSAEYDRLMEAADVGADAADSEKRRQDYIQAEKLLIEQDAAVVPVYQNGGAIMINPKVTGIEFHSASVDSYRHMKKAD